MKITFRHLLTFYCSTITIIVTVALSVFLPIEVNSKNLVRQVSRAGPADNPDNYPDYGGTPDSSLSKEIGLNSTEIESLLLQMVSLDKSTRIEAALELRNNAGGSEQTIREMLWKNHFARNAQMRVSMKTARRIVANSSDKNSNGGILGALLSMNVDDPDMGQGTKACIRVMGMLVALYNLNSMAGYKVILDFSPRHAGVFRQEIGIMMVSRGFDALPALIYGRGSANKELHMFSVKWIRDMGNPLLGEQIQGIKQPRRLAQLIEAYTSVNELDAVDVTVSLANHDSVFVRRAARACLEVFGKNAKWVVRRTFENTCGTTPSEGTKIDQWLSQLYSKWDDERIAVVADIFKEGKICAKSGDFIKMDEKYKIVLSESPMFSKRHEMANGYLSMLTWLENEDLEDKIKLEKAKKITRLTVRLAYPNSDEARLAKSHLNWINAEINRFGGAADLEMYKNVVKQDPQNDAAADIVDKLTPDVSGQDGLATKALLISLFLFISALLVFVRLRFVKQDL